MESNRLVKDTNQIISSQETTFWHFETQQNVCVCVNRACFTHNVQTIPGKQVQGIVLYELVHTCSQGQEIVCAQGVHTCEK